MLARHVTPKWTYLHRVETALSQTQAMQIRKSLQPKDKTAKCYPILSWQEEMLK